MTVILTGFAKNIYIGSNGIKLLLTHLRLTVDLGIIV